MHLQQICVKLWCEVPGGSGNCKTAEIPAADGTPCGDSKVTVNALFDHSKRFFRKDRNLGPVMVTGIYFVARKKCKCITFCCKTDNLGEFCSWFGLLQEKPGLFNEDGTVGFIKTYHRFAALSTKNSCKEISVLSSAPE